MSASDLLLGKFASACKKNVIFFPCCFVPFKDNDDTLIKSLSSKSNRDERFKGFEGDDKINSFLVIKYLIRVENYVSHNAVTVP